MSVVPSGERWLVGSDMCPRRSGTFDTHLSKTCNLSLKTPGPGTYVQHGMTGMRSGESRCVSADLPVKFTAVEGASLDKGNLAGLDRAQWFQGRITQTGLSHCPHKQNDTKGPAAYNLGGYTTDGRSPSFKDLVPSHRRPKQTIGKAKRFRELERVGMVQAGIQMIPMPGPGEYISSFTGDARTSDPLNMAPVNGVLHHSTDLATQRQAFGLTATGISSDASQRKDDKRARQTWICGKMHESGGAAPAVVMQRRIATTEVASDARFKMEQFSSFRHSSFNSKCRPNSINKVRSDPVKKQSRYSAQPQTHTTTMF